ncbi:putative peptidoglycan hydrolase [Nocardia cerradoensis]|uniref:Putative peptidoglycan hydrolase n=1 Tax=Nocardia cerradoensis TaxID=85688 RepID=A0A231HD02_9NOCA|nr:DUF1906 domain-containing protein [Nocardia cerradoensis]OXR46682.1 putative peptidoglycan hydrolase [Nocardia cerradoensis]
MRLGLDYAGGRPDPQAIRAAGYDFVVRYLSDGGPGLPGKLLTPDEADGLRRAGVDIVANWETTANRMLGGFPAGQYDATLALAQAQACGMPTGRPIYFSADWDAAEDEQGPIDDYLRGAASVLGAENVGIYGGYWPASRALNDQTAQWEWQTDAWSGGNTDDRRKMHQRIEQVWVDGVQCDVNEAVVDDFGQWSYIPAPNQEEDMADIDTVIGDIREQLCGQGAREQGYPGWVQLGQNPDGSNRDLVDAIAFALSEIAEIKAAVKPAATPPGVAQ